MKTEQTICIKQPDIVLGKYSQETYSGLKHKCLIRDFIFKIKRFKEFCVVDLEMSILSQSLVSPWKMLSLIHIGYLDTAFLDRRT